MKPGKYLARIVDHEINQKEGTQDLSVGVAFEVKVPNAVGQETVEKARWYGSFKGGARPITVETLLRLGYTGKDGSDLSRWQGEGKPLKPMVLNTDMDFELVFEDETYNGKTRTKIKYINIPGRDSLKRGGSEVQAIVGGMNLGADFAELRAQGKGAPAAAAPKASISEDEIPF